MDADETMKTETPRTLLSSMLEHSEPVQTLRRPSRGTLSRSKRRSDTGGSGNCRQNKTEITSVGSSISVMGQGSKQSDKTPRALVLEALQKHNIQKTLRIPLRQTHPRVILLNKSKERQNHQSLSQLQIPKVDLNQMNIEKNNVDIQKTSDPATLPDANKNLNISRLSSIGDDEIVLDRKSRVKRIRLSDIDLSRIGESTELTSFTDDLFSKVQALIASRGNKTDQGVQKQITALKKKQHRHSSPQLSSTRITSYFEVSRKSDKHEISCIDATTNTEREGRVETIVDDAMHQESSRKENTPEESTLILPYTTSSGSTHFKQSKLLPDAGIVSQDELVSPSTISDMSSDMGPLELSRITEDEIGLDDEQIPTKVHITSSSNNPATKTPTDNEQNVSHNFSRQSSGRRAAENSDVWPDSMLKKQHENEVGELFAVDDSSSSENEQEPAVYENLLETESNENDHHHERMEAHSEDVSIRPQEIQAAVKKKVKARKRRPPYGLPFPRTQLSGIVQHYSTLKMSKEAFNEIEEISRKYFMQTTEHLERIDRSKKRKTISAEDVINLMERRKHVTGKKPLYVLIEENLPLEYREELIPVAIAGNSVVP